jgi:hypothetical protein
LGGAEHRAPHHPEESAMVASTRSWFGFSFIVTLALVSAAGADEEMPKFTGNGSITQAIDGTVGAVLDIGSGITMTFPKGLPVGKSRLVTLKKAAKKPSGNQVQKGFVPIGTPVDFSTPISAGDKPIVLAITQRSDPRKKSERLVLAVEVGTLCNAENKSTKGKNGLCSGWELVDAQYDGAGQRLVANLQSTGGMRLVFGLVPGS